MKRKLWTFLAAAGLVSGLSACWGFGSLMVRPTPSPVAPALAPAGDVTIESTDGLRLAATYWPGRTPQSPGILLLHGNGSSRAATRANAEWLAGHGYSVLTVDFRGCGESSPAPHSFGLFESRDAKAAFDWLRRSRPGAPVAVIGVSLGGAAALLGDEGPLPADAMILQAVYPDIRRAVRNRIAAAAGTAPAYVLEPLLSLQSRPRFGVWPSRLSPLDALGGYRGPVARDRRRRRPLNAGAGDSGDVRRRKRAEISLDRAGRRSQASERITECPLPSADSRFPARAYRRGGRRQSKR